MGNWACWTSIQVYSNNYFILSIFYITITNRSWHIATLSNDKESTKPLCLRSNTKAKEKKSDYNVFDLLLVRGLFSFCPSLTLFSFPASLSLHCHCQPFNLSASVHKNVLVYFIFFFPCSVPHLFFKISFILSPFPPHFLILSPFSCSQPARLPQFVQPSLEPNQPASSFTFSITPYQFTS